MNEIRNIEDKHGLVAFRMGLTHIFDMGHRHMDDEAVAEGVKQIIAKGLEDKANGKNPVMTPEFQCDILRCAAELAQFSIWTLFAYIKNHMEVKL
jgi:hypothetical protein